MDIAPRVAFSVNLLAASPVLSSDEELPPLTDESTLSPQSVRFALSQIRTAKAKVAPDGVRKEW